jgi:protein tyrosine phosphatase (PTP) superfamily phosphohydrolase (DUF442 family)
MNLPGNNALATALAALCLALASVAAHAQAWADAPPNLVQATPQIFTSGQPGPKSLESLKSQGFEAVIYLAPPTVSDAVKDEAKIVGSQGITWVNIPIAFNNPTGRDFETFAAVMKALAPRKVLVHCQVNMRASTMTFLYRALVLHEKPDVAWKDVTKIWVPEGPWKRLVEDEFRKHGIAFDLL